MKPNLGRYQDPEANDLSIKLNNILSRINLDNVKYQTLTGTTNATPNTQMLLKHGLDPRPWVVLFQQQSGGCYIFGISNTDVDVRSTVANSTFTCLALG